MSLSLPKLWGSRAWRRHFRLSCLCFSGSVLPLTGLMPLVLACILLPRSKEKQEFQTQKKMKTRSGLLMKVQVGMAKTECVPGCTKTKHHSQVFVFPGIAPALFSIKEYLGCHLSPYSSRFSKSDSDSVPLSWENSEIWIHSILCNVLYYPLASTLQEEVQSRGQSAAIRLEQLGKWVYKVISNQLSSDF